MALFPSSASCHGFATPPLCCERAASSHNYHRSMRHSFSTVILLFAASALLSRGETAAPGRAVYNFNPGWKLFVGDPAGAETRDFDDDAWKSVTLPHAWNEDDAFRR